MPHSLDPTQSQIDVLLPDFEAAWQRGDSPRLEEVLSACHEADRLEAFKRLLSCELSSRQSRGQRPAADEYLARWPEFRTQIEEIFALVLGLPAQASASSLVSDEGATDTWRPGKLPTPIDSLRPPDIPGYRLLETLGRGGMGFVVKAYDPKLERPVAIKVPLPERLRSDEDRERFVREARSAARLRHPNICPIYEIGTSPERPYIAMGFIAGEPLNRYAKSNSLSARESAELVAALAEGVHYAHQHGVVHRDIKPANVMVDTETRQPVLMDFGLAKDLSDEEVHLTHSGTILGTPAYMAPEQAAGDLAQIGARSDVYALGAVLYWLLCGRAPFEGSFGEVLKLVQTTEPPAPRKLHHGLHRDLETICQKAMAREPEMRYESAGALSADLRRFCRGEAILARPEGVAGRLWRFARKRPLAVAGVAAMLLLMVLSGWLVERARFHRSVTQLSQQIDAGLEAGQWTTERYRGLEDQIAQLGTLDAAEAERARQRLIQRYAASIAELIAQPTSHTHQDLSAIGKHLDFLAQRDARRTDALRADLDGRLRGWLPLFELSSPFEQVPPQLDAAKVAAAGGSLERPVETKAEDAIVATNVPCEGNIELSATFAEPAADVQRLGLALNLTPQESYQFVIDAAAAASLAAPDDASDPSPTLAEMRGQRKPVGLVMLRNGVPLHRQTVQLQPGPLTLSAQREGSRWTFQLQGHPATEFEDVFPLGSREPGVFGLVWPAGVRLEHLRARRQGLPATPSPLEQGDFLFAGRQFAEALDSYRSQEAGADDEVRQESRCKQAMCLLELNREDEGARLLESLAAETGKRWPLVAASQLWLLRVKQGQFDQADLLREVIVVHHEFKDLVSLVPEYWRKTLLTAYRRSTQGTNLLSFDQGRLRRLESVLEVEKLVAGEPSLESRLALLRGYHALGRHRSASDLAAETIHSRHFGPMKWEDRVWLIEELCWLWRLQGQPQRALELVNQHLKEGSTFREDHLPLLVERARTHATLDRWEEAQRDVRRLLEQVPAGRLLYRHYSAARLLEGFCRKRAGDESGAQAAWRAGLYRVWRPQRMQHLAPGDLTPPELPAENYNAFSGMEMVQFILLSSLTAELTSDEEARIFGWLTSRSGGTVQASVLQMAVSLLQQDFTGLIFKGMCRTPRGEDAARLVALQSIDLPTVMRYPIYLSMYEVARQGALARDLSPEEDLVVWESAQRGYRAAMANELGKHQILALALTWKGTSGPLGWDGVAPGLKPDLRGQLAFLLAHRYQRLKKPAESQRLFQTALDDAPPDSLLRRLAEQELKRLSKGQEAIESP